MSTITIPNTLAAGSTNSSSELNENFSALNDGLSDVITLATTETVGGTKTFSSAFKANSYLEFAEITKPTAVAAKFQLYCKDDGTGTELYGQDAAGNECQITKDGYYYSYDSYTGTGSLASGDTLTIAITAETDYAREVSFYAEVTASTENEYVWDFAAAGEESYTQFDCKQTATKFQVDTLGTSGHFETTAGGTLSIGTGNTCAYIRKGSRFKLLTPDTVYEITDITGTGSGDDYVFFQKQDGTTSVRPTGTYDVSWVYGTEFDSGNIQLNHSLGATTTTWERVLTANQGNYAGMSMRQEIDATAITTSGSKVRITFKGVGATYPFWVDNASIVEQDSGANGTATPTDLSFTGAESWDGTNLGQGGNGFQTYTEITSEWVDFTIDESKTYLVIFDWHTLSTVYMMCKYGAALAGHTMYYKAATDSYDQQTVTGFSSSASYIWGVTKVEVRTDAYPITSAYPVATTDTYQLDITNWVAINSCTVSETLGSQKISYAFSFDDRATWRIYDATGGDAGWRPIARNNSGTWQYNSNVTAGYTDVTWSAATINSQGCALSQAFGVTANQMTGTELNALTITEWGAGDGFDAADTTLDFAAGFQSTSATATPVLASATMNYDTAGYYIPIYHGSDWTMEDTDEASTVTNTTATTTTVRGTVIVFKA